MEEGPVRSQVEDGQALLTIDRPAARNALSPDVVQALQQAVEGAKADPRIRVIVLTGAGDRTFCAGGDLGASSSGSPASAERALLRARSDGMVAAQSLRNSYGALLESIAGSPLPVVARVNGHALGGGLGLVLACDMAIAVDSAELGTPEIDVGLFPMMVLAWLRRHVGRKRALQLLLTGERLSAAEALQWGLVNRVVPRAELDRATGELAAKLAGKSRAVVALGKSAFQGTEDMPLEEAMDFLAAQLSLVLGTEDAAEGIAAFLERRPARWKDR